MYNIQRVKVPVACGCVSLVGSVGEFPLDHANYFWMDLPNEKSARVLNMWWENMEEAEKRFLKDGVVEIVLITELGHRWAIVDDPRIPNDWYNKFNYTSSKYPTDVGLVNWMYDFVDSTDNQRDEVLNPKKYWESLGCTYKNGVVTQPISTHLRELSIEYTMERSKDHATYYCPYIPLMC